MKRLEVMLEMQKSEMDYDIVMLIRDKVIGFEDLEGFSEELKAEVRLILHR